MVVDLAAHVEVQQAQFASRSALAQRCRGWPEVRGTEETRTWPPPPTETAPSRAGAAAREPWRPHAIKGAEGEGRLRAMIGSDLIGLGSITTTGGGPSPAGPGIGRSSM